MDIGRLLDGTPEPPSIVHTLDFFIEPFENNQDGDYSLPVPMTEFQRQLCDEVVSLHYSDILKFYDRHDWDDAAFAKDQVLSTSLEDLYKNSQLVAIHPFLVVDHYMPTNLFLKNVPNHLCKYSGKFNTLAQIIDIIRTKHMNVALVCNNNKKESDIIEAVLLGKSINYKRYTGNYLRSTPKVNKKHSTVHLFSSNAEYSRMKELDDNIFFNFVIAFDTSFDLSEPHIERLRAQPKENVKGPIIRLIPYYSAEHVANKFHNLIHDRALFMKRVVAAIVILRGRVGTIPVDLRPYYAQGLKFLEPWFNDLGGNTGKKNEKQPQRMWPIPPLPDINIYSGQDVEYSLLTEVTVVNAKKQVEAVKETTNGKDNNSKDNLQVVDEVIVPDDDEQYYDQKRLRREVYSPEIPETALSFLALPMGSPLDDGQVLTHKILRLLENSIEGLTNKTSELLSLKALTAAQQACQDDTLSENKTFLSKISQLEEKIVIYDRKSERHAAEMQALHERKEQQAAEIAAIKTELLGKVDPPPAAEREIDFATYERQRERIQYLESELGKVADANESRQSENDYMRVEYQKASAAVADYTKEIAALQEENATLDARMKQAVVEMHALSFAKERSEQDKQLLKLENRLEDLEEKLRDAVESERLYVTRSTRAVGGRRGGGRKSPASDSSSGRS
ncbi:hypothetical protein D0Z00_001809 [Geotrichum galactomycetum]|uniref:Uncharacterized protein n=1 Tax=Geotrichum galactomycetum TaxID=27317 RepID=A0ACB6V600_9ASCO|nr:hypothetical protein D0Z00_001809 [Geotrichum candidum]